MNAYITIYITVNMYYVNIYISKDKGRHKEKGGGGVLEGETCSLGAVTRM
jgi:hypothetical protein